jgi:hypothetical protein
MAVFGPTGSGKTKLIHDYTSGFVREKKAIRKDNGDYADRLPVLSVSVRDTTLKSITETLYTALMEEPAPDARRYDLEDSIAGLARDMEVKLVIFDEAHQSIDQRTDSVAKELARFFKDLSNRGIFSMAIVGTEAACRMIKSSPELERRTLVTRWLRPFDWDDRESRSTFLTLLAEFDKELKQVFGKLCGLTNPELAVPIHLASEALIGKLAKLVENAGNEASYDIVDGKADCITVEHFARAFELGALDTGRTNPFRMANVEPWRPPVLMEVNARPAAVSTRRLRNSKVGANFRP